MKPVFLAFSLLGLLVWPAGAAKKQTLPASSVGKNIEIIGTLGVPVGKVVTIKGRKTSSITVRDQFEVTSVDGKAAKLLPSRPPGERGEIPCHNYQLQPREPQRRHEFVLK